MLEISSFQLDDIHHFAPSIGVITNITPDHLDRYENNFSRYIQSKLRLTMNQTNDQFLLFNADDEVLVKALEESSTRAHTIPFGFSNSYQRGTTIEDQQFIIKTNKTTTMIHTTKFLFARPAQPAQCYGSGFGSEFIRNQ